MSDYKNCLTKLKLLIKNYQYIDKHTIIGLIELYSIVEGNIYHLRQKQSKFTRAIFVVVTMTFGKLIQIIIQILIL